MRHNPSRSTRITSYNVCYTKLLRAFRYAILRRAFEKARADGFCGTDEVSLVERLGEKVAVVTGAESNIKITRPEDLALAEMLLAARR